MTELTAMDWLWCEVEGFIPMTSASCPMPHYAMYIDRPHQHEFIMTDKLERWVTCHGCGRHWSALPRGETTIGAK